MIYFFQSVGLKTRALGVLLASFLVLASWWLLSAAPWSLGSLRVLGHGAGLPNLGFWTFPDDVSGLLDQWGPDGKALYLKWLAPSSVGFFVALGVFLVLAILYLLKKGNPANPWWYLLPLVPLGATALGLLEVASLVLATFLPFDASDVACWAAGVLGMGRWTVFALATAILGAGTVICLVRKAWERLRALGSRAGRF
jgi:hypothetical protein